MWERETETERERKRVTDRETVRKRGKKGRDERER